MTGPLSPEREQQIRAEFERTTHPDWRDTTTVGVLLAELDRLRAELAKLRACDCYPNPNDHADRCPIFLAAYPSTGEENW